MRLVHPQRDVVLREGVVVLLTGVAWTAGVLLSKLTEYAGTGYAALTLSLGVIVATAMRYPERPLQLIGGVLLGNLVMAFTVSRPLLSPVIAAFVNGSEAVLIARLLRRFGTATITYARDALALWWAATIGSVLAATLGTLTLGPIEGRQLPGMWMSWASADTLGVVLVLPLLMGMKRQWPRPREALVLVGAFVLAGCLGGIAVSIVSGGLKTTNVFLQVLPWYGLLLLPLLSGVEFGAVGVGIVQLPAALSIFAAHPATDLAPWLERVALTTLLSISLLAAVLAIRRQVTQRELSESVTRTLFELSPEPTAHLQVSLVDAQLSLQMMDANRAMRDLLGVSARGCRGEDLTRFVHPEDVETLRSVISGKPGMAEVRMGRRSKRNEQICRISATTAHTSESGVSEVIVVLRDVTELRRAVDRLETQARLDSLTGLLNRRAFLEAFTTLISTERREHLGLIFADVDSLKAINDERGHAAGDVALRATAMRIQRALRVGDIAGRYGGDEFVVAVQVQSEEALEALRSRLDASLSEPLLAGPLDVALSCSVGATLALPQDSAEDLLRRADGEMYRRKRERRSARD